jgi:hypothetical protein
MSQYLSPDEAHSPNLLSLLDKLASHPNGLELAKLTYQIYLAQSEALPKPEAAGRNRLIAIAMEVVRRRGIVNPPYFKSMSDDLIRAFIAQYSATT